jgi:outer membrane protein OmpA-like peptidoglycan-associated protein
MKHLLMAGAAAVALGAAAPASAQVFGFSPPSGAYVAGDVGYHWPQAIESKSSVGGLQWDFSSEDDWAGFGRLGYRINPNWRVELEGGYRPGDIDSVRGPGAQTPVGLCRAGIARPPSAPTCQAPEGSIRASSLMFNVLFDIGAEDARFRPFIGGGVGVVEVHNKVFGQLSNVAPGTAAFQNVSIDDMEQALAWQGIAGVAIALTDRLFLDVTGRYLQSGDMEFGSVTQFAGRPGVLTNVGTFEGDYRDTSLTLGLRYQFGAPVAPPMPAPAPAPAPMPTPPPAEVPAPPPAPAPVSREFIVYFPFDQYVLTPEAQGVISEAANYARSGAPTSITVVGHADTSGSAAYNVRLSERRAKAVADALAGQGVPQTALQVDWRGETQPAVPTPDGTKEPLNRRTTIGINF